MLKKSTLSAVLIAMVAITSSAVLVVSETTRRDGRTAFAAAPTSQPNLAGLLRQTNRPSEVEPLLRRALAIDEKSYGSDHPEVATDLNNLAGLLRPSEAEPLFRRALAIDEKSYGPDHPEVATDLNNLAVLLSQTNRPSEAEPLYRRALAIDEKSYGPDHPNVAIRLDNLALLLQGTNRLSEAEPLFGRALAIDEKRYGPDHPTTERIRTNLRSLQDSLGGSKGAPFQPQPNVPNQ